MQQKFSTAADLCRIVFLLTAVSLLWSVEGLFEREQSIAPPREQARPVPFSR